MALARYVFGVPRSGSTLAYNLVRLLTGEPVEHTHSFVVRTDAKLPMVCTFRDFRDCAAAWWLTKDGGDYSLLWPRMLLLNGFIAALNSYRHNLAYPPDRLFFARYEKWVQLETGASDSAEIVKLEAYAAELNERLGLRCCDADIRHAAEQCQIEAMRARGGDPLWKIDGQVNDGRSKWREVVKPEDQQRVTEFFAADLEAWGYEL